ncbi:MAG: hypothetical protein EOO59_17800 [Hymenobacter sp.]|nr:MAG: hypothetical protein EOO59_17800 [Hymenobacter sp.]
MQQIYFWGRRVARRAAPVLAMGGLVGSLLGAPAWAQAPAWVAATAGSPQQLSGNSEVQGTAVDASGNVLVVGYFSGQVAFGTTMLTSAGGTDLFVAKWNPTTNAYVWAQRAGSNNNEFVFGLVVQGSSIYIVGQFYGITATFGSTTLTSQFGYAGYVAKLTDSGGSAAFAWAQQAGGAGLDYAYGLVRVGTQLYVGG